MDYLHVRRASNMWGILVESESGNEEQKIQFLPSKKVSDGHHGSR